MKIWWEINSGVVYVVSALSRSRSLKIGFGVIAHATIQKRCYQVEGKILCKIHTS